ncbi:MAG: ribonuclease P protein component [Dehalococcoidia bacterium]|nr:ribonuclease P protein component [Dehalococcoidia bacterium]MDW8008059.1 ribonuclease P protein component [Chloroflexota bacterium]
MGKLLRLHGRKAFDQVFRRGRIYRHELMVLRTLPNGLPYSRMGLVTGKRLGKATVRNRTKRRLREAVRRLPLAPGWDFVFVLRPPAAAADYWQIEQAARHLLARAGVLSPQEPGREA